MKFIPDIFKAKSEGVISKKPDYFSDLRLRLKTHLESYNVLDMPLDEDPIEFLAKQEKSNAELLLGANFSEMDTTLIFALMDDKKLKFPAPEIKHEEPYVGVSIIDFPNLDINFSDGHHKDCSIVQINSRRFNFHLFYKMPPLPDHEPDTIQFLERFVIYIRLLILGGQIDFKEKDYDNKVKVQKLILDAYNSYINSIQQNLIEPK